MALSHHEAQFLVSEWAVAQLNEVRHMWFSATAPGFSDHVSGYRESYALTEKDVRIEATGWIMVVLMVNKRVHHEALKRHFLDGQPVGKRARKAALDAFCRAHEAWQSTLENI